MTGGSSAGARAARRAGVRDQAAAAGVGALSDLAVERLISLSGGRADDLSVLFATLDPAQLRDPRLDAPPDVAASALGPLDPPLEEAGLVMMATVAVLGDDAVVPFVVATSGLSLAQATRGLDEVEGHPAIVVSDGPVGRRLAFERPLRRAATYRSLTSAHRRELHLRAADLLEGDTAFRHLVAATSGPDARLAGRAEDLATDAMARADWPAAAAWWLTAARLRGRASHRRADLLAAAEALLTAGDGPGASALLGELGDPGRDGPAQLLAGRLAAMGGDLVAGERHLVAAWSGCDPADDRVASQAASHLAAICFADARGDDAVLWAAPALDRSTPEASGRDVDPLTRLLLSYGLAGRVDEGVEQARSRGVGDAVVGSSDGVLGQAGLRLVLGQLAPAVAALDALALRSERDGPLPLWWYGQAWRSFAAVHTGSWDDALTLAADAARAADVEAWSFAALGHFAPVVVHAARGEATVAARELDVVRQAVVAAGSPRLLRMWVAALEAWMAEIAGQHETVLMVLGPWHPDELVRAVGPLLPCVATMAIRALARLGRVAECDATADALGPAGGPIDAAWRAGSDGARWARDGDLDRARTGIELALATLPSDGYPLDRARLHLEAGSMLRRAGKRRAAQRHLLMAIDGFEALAARPFLTRAQAELATSGPSPARRSVAGASADGGGLTPAEQAVAALVGVGRTNRETAAELYVSAKTVEYHLGNIYRKLGVTNRTQLAARLDRTGPRPSF